MTQDFELEARNLKAQMAVARRARERREKEHMNTPLGPDSQAALIEQSWDAALERVLAKRNPPAIDANVD